MIAVITVVAIITKLIGGGLGARIGGMSWRPALTVGAGMVSRGEVALVLAGAALAAGVINGTIFSALIVMTLVTTLVTPPLLRWMIPSTPPPTDAVAQDEA